MFNGKDTKMNNRICTILGIEKPIIQAPMSWLTDAKFVANVSNAGGLGFLGPHAGQTTNPTSSEEVLARMQNEIRKVKSMTDKPFGVPVILSYDISLIPAMAELLIAEQVPVVLINDVLDVALFQQFNKAGIKIIYRPVTPNIENAQKAERLGADIFVATGFDEGGTLPAKEIGSFSALAMIESHINIPIMLAGGIADVSGVRAALTLGAEGIYAGSVFIATQESRAARNVKDLIVQSSSHDLLLFRTEPYYYRSLPTALGKKLHRMSEQGESRNEVAKVMNAGTGMRLGMLEGDLENGYISVGTGISHITSIRSIKEVIDDLMQDYI